MGVSVMRDEKLKLRDFIDTLGCGLTHWVARPKAKVSLESIFLNRKLNVRTHSVSGLNRGFIPIDLQSIGLPLRYT